MRLHLVELVLKLLSFEVEGFVLTFDLLDVGDVDGFGSALLISVIGV
jgi:hypothetical protein